MVVGRWLTFSLHAATAIGTNSRQRLYKLVEYMGRGPVTNERLQETAKGNIRLELKTPWDNGKTTHLEFSPEEFLEKLIALVPQPNSS